MNSPNALILGCGYVGLRLARRLVTDGYSVTATTSRTERFAEIEAAGAHPVRADVLEPTTLRSVTAGSNAVVFDLVRPQQIAADRYTTWGTRNIASLLAENPPGALVYLSSTSVYDTRHADWMDETTEVHPSTAFGEARAEAERIYLDLFRESGFPARICRAPAVYGPRRTLKERLEGGAYTRLDDEEQWVSRIHVDDLVTGLIAAWRRGRPGGIYLFCDDEPVTGREYAELTAQLLALPLPPMLPREDIRQELGSGGFERRTAAGRCVNQRTRVELGIGLKYPSVREGVPASLAEEGAI